MCRNIYFLFVFSVVSKPTDCIFPYDFKDVVKKKVSRPQLVSTYCVFFCCCFFSQKHVINICFDIFREISNLDIYRILTNVEAIRNCQLGKANDYDTCIMTHFHLFYSTVLYRLVVWDYLYK